MSCGEFDGTFQRDSSISARASQTLRAQQVPEPSSLVRSDPLGGGPPGIVTGDYRTGDSPDPQAHLPGAQARSPEGKRTLPGSYAATSGAHTPISPSPTPSRSRRKFDEATGYTFHAISHDLAAMDERRVGEYPACGWPTWSAGHLQSDGLDDVERGYFGRLAPSTSYLRRRTDFDAVHQEIPG